MKSRCSNAAWSVKRLSLLKPIEIQSQLPRHLQHIIEKAVSDLNVSSIILFGSRARGDARENSDFDLAFKFYNRKNWAQFVSDIQEDSPSLYNYDLVDLDNCDLKFQKKIRDEGVVIYDEKS